MRRILALLMTIVMVTACLPPAMATTASNADGTAVVTPDDVPSDWAYDEVKQAIVLGMVPSSMQNHWRTPITRIEFAQLVVRFLAFQYGYSSDSNFVSDYCSHTTDRNGDPFGAANQKSWWNQLCGEGGPFTDLVLHEDRGYGNTAYRLGIVNGRGGDIFGAKDPITRQEAAAMLMRCYQRYGGDYESGSHAGEFTDWTDVADWAEQAVSDLVDLRVMNGTSGGQFDPEGTYTREQAVLTLLRLYANAPVSRSQQNIPKL